MEQHQLHVEFERHRLPCDHLARTVYCGWKVSRLPAVSVCADGFHDWKTWEPRTGETNSVATPTGRRKSGRDVGRHANVSRCVAQQQVSKRFAETQPKLRWAIPMSGFTSLDLAGRRVENFSEIHLNLGQRRALATRVGISTMRYSSDPAFVIEERSVSS